MLKEVNFLSRDQGCGNLFDMFRSFVTLARTLNLSETVEILHSTRQTVRGHIDKLEELRGENLFRLKNQRYELSTSGRGSLAGAEFILAQGNAWFLGQYHNVDGLAAIKLGKSGLGDETFFCSQQHPIDRIWQDGTPLIQAGFESWIKAGGHIDHKALATIRPYAMIFKPTKDDWICVEMGQQSALTQWFGNEWAQNAVGKPLSNYPCRSDYGDFVMGAYKDVSRKGSARLEHQHRLLPAESGSDNIPISFQRLLLACKFPDNSEAILSLIDMTYDVCIDGVDQSQVSRMPKEMILGNTRAGFGFENKSIQTDKQSCVA